MIVIQKQLFLYYNSNMDTNIKTLAILGSGNGSNFEIIANFFKINKDVEIVCLSDVEDAFILERAEKLGIKHQYLPFDENFEYFSKNKFDLVVLAGYMRVLPSNVLDVMDKKVVNIHPSLLPAFKGSKNAIQEAFIAGVKVSGVTIHWVDNDVDGGKIIAQYPVFINNETHLDEFEEDIHNIEHKLYPIVIEKVLDNKVFDFQDLMKSSCHDGSCGGGGCGGKCGNK